MLISKKGPKEKGIALILRNLSPSNSNNTRETLIPRVAEALGAYALASATAYGGTEGFI